MKIPANTLDLKQFLSRKEVLKLYRVILKTIKEIPDESNRKYMRNWARTDFRSNKTQTDPYIIKHYIKQGEIMLKELQTSLQISK